MKEKTKSGYFKNEVSFTEEEIREFKAYWGQSQSEITALLGYPKNHSESDELLIENYFWIEEDKAWYPKQSSFYTEKDRAIADYLRKKSQDS